MMKKYIIFIIDAYNIRSSICTKELAPSEIQCTDYTDYLLKGNLTLKNGHIDKYQFDEGYCQAEKNISDANKDDFTFCYYDQDHLGNIRQVTKADVSQTGNIVQTINYYPFGMQFCDGTTCYFDQKHKYNGKEFDNMYGLNTYDYGARQYNPVTARWDRMDPLCEKYYNVSPYVYCANNPINIIDMNRDSLTIDLQAIRAIYNAVEDGEKFSMTFVNGVLDPNSIKDAAENSDNPFIQDLYDSASTETMVELKETDENTSVMNGVVYHEKWANVCDFNVLNEKEPTRRELIGCSYPVGKTIQGNLGQTLYPLSSNELKRSTNENIQILINCNTTLNQRSCGIAHEFAHVLLYINHQPHSHSDDADYIYQREWNVMKKYNYDYLESTSGKIFRK